MEGTDSVTRVGKLALMMPETTSTLGLCVANTK